MSSSPIKMLIAASVLAAASVSAFANTTLYSTNNLMTNYSGNNSTVNASFASLAATHADLSFQLGGSRSLDGANNYSDVFTLSLNGTQIFRGTFNLGGGGANKIFFNPYGASVLVTTFGTSFGDPHNSTQNTWAGGIADISLSNISLNSGLNTLTFGYGSNLQGIGDEGWKVNAVNVTASAVPEPETYAMFLAGLGLIGAAVRRRKNIA